MPHKAYLQKLSSALTIKAIRDKAQRTAKDNFQGQEDGTNAKTFYSISDYNAKKFALYNQATALLSALPKEDTSGQDTFQYLTFAQYEEVFDTLYPALKGTRFYSKWLRDIGQYTLSSQDDIQSNQYALFKRDTLVEYKAGCPVLLMAEKPTRDNLLNNFTSGYVIYKENNQITLCDCMKENEGNLTIIPLIPKKPKSTVTQAATREFEERLRAFKEALATIYQRKKSNLPDTIQVFDDELEKITFSQGHIRGRNYFLAERDAADAASFINAFTRVVQACQPTNELSNSATNNSDTASLNDSVVTAADRDKVFDELVDYYLTQDSSAGSQKTPLTLLQFQQIFPMISENNLLKKIADFQSNYTQLDVACCKRWLTFLFYAASHTSVSSYEMRQKIDDLLQECFAQLHSTQCTLSLTKTGFRVAHVYSGNGIRCEIHNLQGKIINFELNEKNLLLNSLESASFKAKVNSSQQSFTTEEQAAVQTAIEKQIDSDFGFAQAIWEASLELQTFGQLHKKTTLTPFQKTFIAYLLGAVNIEQLTIPSPETLKIEILELWKNLGYSLLGNRKNFSRFEEFLIQQELIPGGFCEKCITNYNYSIGYGNMMIALSSTPDSEDADLEGKPTSNNNRRVFKPLLDIDDEDKIAPSSKPVITNNSSNVTTPHSTLPTDKHDQFKSSALSFLTKDLSHVLSSNNNSAIHHAYISTSSNNANNANNATLTWSALDTALRPLQEKFYTINPSLADSQLFEIVIHCIAIENFEKVQNAWTFTDIFYAIYRAGLEMNDVIDKNRISLMMYLIPLLTTESPLNQSYLDIFANNNFTSYEYVLGNILLTDYAKQYRYHTSHDVFLNLFPSILSNNGNYSPLPSSSPGIGDDDGRVVANNVTQVAISPSNPTVVGEGLGPAHRATTRVAPTNNVGYIPLVSLNWGSVSGSKEIINNLPIQNKITAIETCLTALIRGNRITQEEEKTIHASVQYIIKQWEALDSEHKQPSQDEILWRKKNVLKNIITTYVQVLRCSDPATHEMDTQKQLGKNWYINELSAKVKELANTAPSSRTPNQPLSIDKRKNPIYDYTKTICRDIAKILFSVGLYFVLKKNDATIFQLPRTKTRKATDAALLTLRQ